jgi:heme/copper-type cytochrome/quinol oxidase subunit 2
MHHFMKCASVGIVWFVVGMLTYTAWQVWKFEDDQRQATGRRYFSANPITEDSRYVTE